MAPKLVAIAAPSITMSGSGCRACASSAADGVAVEEAHDAFDQDQVGIGARRGQPPARVVLAAHPQVDVLAGVAAGNGMDLRSMKSGPLEDAHPRPPRMQPRRQRCQRRQWSCPGWRRGRRRWAGQLAISELCPASPSAGLEDVR